MKRIVLCGSRKLKEQIIELGINIEKQGFEVVIPKEFFTPMGKKEHSMLHFSEIQNPKTDYVLIVNDEKNGIPNYIGANSFAELAFGFYFGKKVFLKNDIYKPYEDEITGWEVIPLKGDINKMLNYKEERKQ